MNKEALLSIKIDPADRELCRAAMEKWDSISKPIDGLGDFERAIAQIASIQKKLIPVLKDREVIIMCADNGIVEEGISQSTQAGTKSVAINLGKGISSASTLALSCGARVTAVDIGIAAQDKVDGILDRRVAAGTRNFLKGPAMTEEETIRAIETGMELAETSGADILAVGEMGIGNTTTSTLLLCYLLGLDPYRYTGRGAGLDNRGLLRKKEVVQKGLLMLKAKAEEMALARGSAGEALFALEQIGGLDIAGLTGVILGAARSHKPVILDGLITAAAAVIAARIAPAAAEYMLASHEGRESAIGPALAALNLRPYIKGNMALGEGTGAILLFPLLDAVNSFYQKACSFKEVKIRAYRRFDT